jgi:4-diphosphocytidyl-2-C-methyl-D-erythritol kinase
MPKLTVLAPAKINLTFDILGTMPDGYHQVETVLHSIDLMDRLTFSIEPSKELRVEMTGDRAEFPTDDSNLIAKATKAFCTQTKSNVHLIARVEKNIPIGAGLAGGSADAAATLVALNRASDAKLPEHTLQTIGAALGADVPFAIHGGTAFGTNRGEVLNKLNTPLQFTFCVVKPMDLSISTPWAYKKFDAYEHNVGAGLAPSEPTRPQTQQALDALKAGNLEAALAAFGNCFEGMLFTEHPFLGEIKAELLRLGAWYVQLSGSGPALFAIVPDLEHAHFLRRKMSGAHASKLEFHFCQSTPEGVRITEYEHGKATC